MKTTYVWCMVVLGYVGLVSGLGSSPIQAADRLTLSFNPDWRFITAFSYSGPTQIVHVEQDAQDGRNVYVDRDWPFAGMPKALVGADWVQAADGDGLYNAVDLMEMGVKAGSVVSVAYDDRLARPVWLMRQFQTTDLSLKVNSQAMKVFQRLIEKDEGLTLGANTEDTSVKEARMYVVFVNRATPNGPRVFLLDARHLKVVRQQIQTGDKRLEPALARLRQEAKDALKAGPFSVMHKDATPPSGDKHDYMSQAPYWWPNPDAPNGLPYIRRDGERNPEIYKITDHRNMGRMTEAVETLALAYWFTGDEAFAAKAAQLLRAWFLDPATRMKPHLEYGQAVPGLNTGRGIGLIETIGLTGVVDAVGLLAGSKAWTADDQRDLETWFGLFLRWMQESRNGREEAAAKNNHGTYYDLQVASFALFVGRTDLATEVLKAAGPGRIGRQAEPDGRQPLELERTRSWSYSVMNLRGLMSLARIAENVGVDLWTYQTQDGRSIRKALDYLLPFALEDRKWPHRQLGGWSPEGIYPLIRRVAARYPDPSYKTMLSKIKAVSPEDRSHLLQDERAAP